MQFLNAVLGVCAMGCGDSPAEAGTTVESSFTIDGSASDDDVATDTAAGSESPSSSSATETGEVTEPTTSESTGPDVAESSSDGDRPLSSSDSASATTEESSTSLVVGSSTDDGGATGSETGGGDETDSMGVQGEFPPAPPFGSNVLDSDLVGTWGLNWQPENGWDSVLDVDATGEFVWTETSADCSSTTFASGHLWVEGMQIVMHVETWERPLPWDTEPVLGETFPPPFRLRTSFTLQGGGADAYLALSAPGRVAENAMYTGASYVRLAQQGAHLGGTWHGESELLAIPSGASEPIVVVRDVAEALMDPEADSSDPQGTGVRAVTTTYFPVPHADTLYAGGNWTCLGGCTQPAGTTLVDGSNLYTYGPYGGYEHLMTFADGRTFKRDIGTDCP